MQGAVEIRTLGLGGCLLFVHQTFGCPALAFFYHKKIKQCRRSRNPQAQQRASTSAATARNKLLTLDVSPLRCTIYLLFLRVDINHLIDCFLVSRKIHGWQHFRPRLADFFPPRQNTYQCRVKSNSPDKTKRADKAEQRAGAR